MVAFRSNLWEGRALGTKPAERGICLEIVFLWSVKEPGPVNICANPSAEALGKHERLDDKPTLVIDIIDAFRLKYVQFDYKQFCTYIKSYTRALIAKLKNEQKDKFKTDIQAVTKYLFDLPNLKFFAGESMKDDATMVFAYYKEGARNPTFLYLPHALKEVQCN
ncbi:Translationally-controlled tumor protein homolog [Linum grandiflorum]